MVLFGVGNMLSDVIECVRGLGKDVGCIVVNGREQTRERAKDFAVRLRELGGRPVILSLDDFSPPAGEEYFIVPTTPKKAGLVEFLRKTHALHFTRLVHPTAYVSPYARLGEGVFVGAKSVIAAGCVLGDHVFVNRGVTVGHDTVLHEYVRLNPGCNVAGHVEVRPGAVIGLGAGVIEELVIGQGAVVAAGAMVLRDVPDRALVAGAPAVVKKTVVQ